MKLTLITSWQTSGTMGNQANITKTGLQGHIQGINLRIYYCSKGIKKDCVTMSSLFCSNLSHSRKEGRRVTRDMEAEKPNLEACTWLAPVTLTLLVTFWYKQGRCQTRLYLSVTLNISHPPDSKPFARLENTKFVWY